MTKICSKCKTEKSFSEFRAVKPGKGCKNNLHSWCKDCTRQARRQDYKDNTDRYRNNLIRWHQNNPEKQAEYDRNRDPVRRRAQQRASSHNRRARARMAEGFVTPDIIRKVLEAYGNVCLRCGAKENIQIDHVVPLSKGGTNLLENLQPLCRSCNARKSDRNSDDFRPTKKGEGRASP